jgi:NADH-quinone oxidoreductase subunit E
VSRAGIAGAGGGRRVEGDDGRSIFAGFRGVRSELIPILVRIQEREGYLSPEAIRSTSRFLRISENQVFEVASFYPKFRFTEPGRKSIRVCMGTACHVKGGGLLADAIGWKLGISIGQRTPDGRFDFQRVNCMGCCAMAPVVKVNDETLGRMMVTTLTKIMDEHD